MPFKENTEIWNDVWIGQNAAILPGTHIGNDAIIGLNSVAGNPAKKLERDLTMN